MTWTRAAQRSTWRRKSWPSPRPSLAPSMRPGTSATVYVGAAGGDHAEVGHERRERVVGDLGPRAGQRGDEAGLAGAREPDQADVGDDLELEGDDEVLPRLALERESGGLALAGRECGVAQPAAAAGRDDDLGARADQVGQDLASLVADDRAVGDGKHQVVAIGRRCLLLPAPGLPLPALRCGSWW